MGLSPFNNSEDLALQDTELPKFEFVSNLIRHTYLKAPEDSIIYIRKRSGMKFGDEQVSQSSNHFDYERRNILGEQRIHKKRIMTGREYDDLLLNQQDKQRRTLKILRTSFMYDKQYFQLETVTNISGAPSFLLVESHVD